MIRDFRFAARMLGKQPAFASIAVVTLALGIGATSAVFSLIHGVLLAPPPYERPEQMALISSLRNDGRPSQQPWAAAQWLEWQKQSKTFETFAGYSWTFNFLIRPDGSESVEGMVVTRDYFRVAGLQPILGRTFEEADAVPGRPAIILGYELWQRKFNADPQIAGKTVRMSRRDVPPMVIGVMPPGVRFLPSPGAAKEPNYNVNATVDFWVLAVPSPARLKSPQWDVVGRLRPGMTVEQGQGELKIIAARQAQTEREFEGYLPQVVPLATEMNRDGRRILLPLLGAAGLVLLIACGNVAALLLVRGLQRQQEYAVRSALGVDRAGLFRQVSAESLLLAFAGGALGVCLAIGIVRVFKAIGGHAIPRLDAVTTGWPMLAWGFGTAVIAAWLAGVIPAWRASRMNPVEVLKSAGPKSSASRGERRLLQAVTMTQTALTLALLVGASLLIRTMINLSDVRAGYNLTRVLTMTVTSVQGDSMDFHRRALERVVTIPGVENAAFAWGTPLTGNNWPGTVDIEGQPLAVSASDRISVPLRSVTPGYFQLFGLAIVEGRDVRGTDVRTAPLVAVVNQALAERYFPHGTAIGKKIWMDGREKPGTEIVGVVANGRTDDLTRAPEPEIYFSFWQATPFSKDLVLRTSGDPRAVIAAVTRELHAVEPTAAVENARTLEQIRNDSLASRTFAMQLLVGFALVGSVLTLVGIYGVLSLSVASRRREIAIRAAVGAERRDIRKLILGEGMRLVAGGVACGALTAIGLSQVLKAFLFQVEPGDPITIIGVALLFMAVAMLACWVPTRRATKVDAIEALRYE